MFKKERGITLVALVVTVVVLLILAGVSISLILGNKGIITMTKKAKENHEAAGATENTQMKEAYNWMLNAIE